MNAALPPSIDPDEVAKFTAMAEEWWDPKGKFRPLHRFNPVRLGFIRDTVLSHFQRDPQQRRPLSGLTCLDIGCGGGLVSEPMTRLGASVTGVDTSPENINTAFIHAQQEGLDIDYRAGTIEELITSNTPAFDIVLNLEVVEHVADPDQFLRDCARLVKPGGVMIVATLNRTAKAFALAIFGAEYVLGWLPKGTHEFSKFLRPEEVTKPLRQAALNVAPPQGVSFNPVLGAWRLSEDTKVNYMLVACRPDTDDTTGTD